MYIINRLTTLLESGTLLGNWGKNGSFVPFCSAWLRLLCQRLDPVGVSAFAPTRCSGHVAVAWCVLRLCQSQGDAFGVCYAQGVKIFVVCVPVSPHHALIINKVVKVM